MGEIAYGQPIVCSPKDALETFVPLEKNFDDNRGFFSNKAVGGLIPALAHYGCRMEFSNGICKFRTRCLGNGQFLCYKIIIHDVIPLLRKSEIVNFCLQH